MVLFPVTDALPNYSVFVTLTFLYLFGTNVVILIFPYTAQDRREMLEDIMRRGTSSLGRDVPSEREINRLAARSDEEFWMFEKMDEERRQKENYRSRLMEDHEVPDWAYAPPETKDSKGKGFDYESANVSGKRRRKEVVYADTLSELQWMKAVENGEQSTKQSRRGRKKEHVPPVANELVYNPAGEKRVVDLSEPVSVLSETTSETTSGSNLKRSKPETSNSARQEFQGTKSDNLKGPGLTWKPYKRKRSNLGL